MLYTGLTRLYRVPARPLAAQVATLVHEDNASVPSPGLSWTSHLP
jgi:hypothetical protein